MLLLFFLAAFLCMSDGFVNHHKKSQYNMEIINAMVSMNQNAPRLRMEHKQQRIHPAQNIVKHHVAPARQQPQHHVPARQQQQHGKVFSAPTFRKTGRRF